MTVFSHPAFSPRLRVSCYLTLVSLAAVIALLLAGNNSLLAKLLLLAPFALVAPGVVLGKYRSYSWLSLMILLYFIVAVTQAMGPAGNWMDTMNVALTVVVFFAATFSSRWLQQEQQAGHFATEQESPETH